MAGHVSGGPLTSASEGALTVHAVSAVLGGLHSGPELLTDVQRHRAKEQGQEQEQEQGQEQE